MNKEIQESIEGFLAQKSIAVVGDTWKSDDAAVHLTQKLKNLGYQVFPICKEQKSIHEVTCYDSLQNVGQGIDAVMVTGNEKVSLAAVKECINLKIKYVWLHSALGTSPKKWMRKIEYQISSVGKDAVELARQNGIHIIPGGCPNMFKDPDIPHRLVKKVLLTLGCFEEREFS